MLIIIKFINIFIAIEFFTPVAAKITFFNFIEIIGHLFFFKYFFSSYCFDLQRKIFLLQNALFLIMKI